MGLSAFDGGTGAAISVGIDDIATNRATMVSAIDALTPSGSTPLAESLHELGRYFVGQSNPQYDGLLTLHPGQANETTKDDDAVFDNSPNYASGVAKGSPVQYFCQQTFAVLMTDGRPQSDRDIADSTGLTDYDGDCADGSCDTYDRKPSRTYESGGSDYLDDVAAALYDMDLRPDLDDFAGNEVKNNVKTYTIGFADDQVINDPLMQDTAANGNGLFLTASNSSELGRAFEDAAQDILSQVGSIAAVSFNTATLTSGSQVFQARFNTTRWSGELHAFNLEASGTISSEIWEAGDVLNSTSPSARQIITNTSNNTALPFTSGNLGSLSSVQQNDLNMGPSGADGRGTDRIDYLRGDDADEGTASSAFRIRTTPLGDIVHSSPIFVGAPSQNYPNVAPFPETVGDRYVDFKNAQQGRTEMLYVGANDGMLHAFRASDGQELLGFIPHELFSSQSNDGLHHLTEQDYEHQYYVDLTPTISDAYIPVVDGGATAWHTVLVGGLRGGGRGLFALDITDPSTFSEANADDLFMWEFTSADDADLGLTFSQPTIARMNNGEWAAVLGNGYNNTGSGTAQLFIVFLDGGLDGTWTLDADYMKIDTEVGSIVNSDCQDASSDCNGLSRPVLADIDGNGTVDRVYAGDLKGNMWAFDVSASNDGNWGSAYSQGNTPRPLFTATDGTTPQPITSQPTLADHP
ncbi:MAG: hypothetical protein GWO02_00520, partial [Gammaproteobacteria bacterium]|nr:hypothetical protein [Gammaproteobacteria bacterium]